MKNFEVIIGIELHIVLKTNTKMFSYAKNTHYSEPNTEVSWMDIALPGMMPQPNKEAIKKGIILADALNMKINYSNIQFDRKNYFYVDLTKGFQITQQYFPIGTEGSINISNKKIDIERIHIEEDTAKKIKEGNCLLMDYNRAGVPLIEIVTKPCISSAEEAYEYLYQLRRLLLFKDISDAKMEDGLMRADVNISLRPKGVQWFNNKVEIKNINSLNNVKKAINFEIKRQLKLLLTNQDVEQETRRFNDITGETEFMRSKSNAVNYRYLTEPNIINFKLSEEEVNNIIKNSNPLPDIVAKKLKEEVKLNDEHINFLLDNYEIYDVFILIYNHLKEEPLQIYNWLTNEIIGLIDKKNIKLYELKEKYLNEILNFFSKLLIKKEINTKQAKNLLNEFFDSYKPIDVLINELGYKQITDEKLIKEIIQKCIDQNKELLEQYNQRPERVEKFLVGMVMRETNSQANPVITMKILKEMLNSK